MKQMIKYFFLLFLFSSVGFSGKVQAQEEVGYSVQTLLPENQRNLDVTYFDLRIEPGMEQELNLVLTNNGSDDITVRGSIYDAATNRNGLIVYEEREETDPSLENPVSELMSFDENEWTIPAGESQTITANLAAPSEEFDGLKMGGFHFEEVEEEEEAAGEGVTIQNRFAYVIGVRLSMNDDPVVPNLNLLSVAPELVNYRTAVVAQVQNDQPLLMTGVTIQADVYEGGSEEPLRQAEQTDIRMAPNSTMDFVINWENQPLEAGDYLLDMTATDTNGTTWEWQEEFTIEAEEELNEEAVELEEDSSGFPVIYIVGIMILLAVIIGLVIYIRKLKRQDNT